MPKPPSLAGSFVSRLAASFKILRQPVLKRAMLSYDTLCVFWLLRSTLHICVMDRANIHVFVSISGGCGTILCGILSWET